MAKKVKPKYPPELMKPVVMPTPLGVAIEMPPGDFSEEALTKKCGEIVDKELEKKRQHLFRHYGVSPDDRTPEALRRLIMMMAMDLIPGFEVVIDAPKPRGRPTSWRKVEGFELYLEVQRDFRKNGHDSVEAACRRLVKTPTYKGLKPTSLKSRYLEVIRTNPIVKAIHGKMTDLGKATDVLLDASE
jgi:hypothetical protein